MAGAIALSPFNVGNGPRSSHPAPELAGHAIIRYLAGAVLAACGFVMIGMGTRRCVAAGTNIPPNLPTTALVVDGI